MDSSQVDEINMVEHMHRVLTNELTGRSHTKPIYQSPLENVLAGVVFPEDTFIKDRRQVESFITNDDDDDDSIPTFNTRTSQASRRLVSIGMEFRSRPWKSEHLITLAVSVQMALYIRLYPTLAEQTQYDNILGLGQNAGTIDDTDDESEINLSPEDPREQGEDVNGTERLELAYKFQRIEVNIPTFTIQIDEQQLDGNVLSFDDVITDTLVHEREHILNEFAAKLVCIHDQDSSSTKKRKRPDSIFVPGPWHDDKTFDAALRKIHGVLNLPNWCGGLHVIPGPDPEIEAGV